MLPSASANKLTVCPFLMFSTHVATIAGSVISVRKYKRSSSVSFFAKASTSSLSEAVIKRRVTALPSANVIRLLKFGSIEAAAIGDPPDDNRGAKNWGGDVGHDGRKTRSDVQAQW